MLRQPSARPYGLVFFQAPSRRQKLARRRMIATAAFAGAAVFSAAIGALAGGKSDASAQTGIFSYFPPE